MRVHVDKKPFRCDRCGKRYRLRYKLSVHMQTHNNKGQYKCEHCGECFTTKDYLSRHICVHKKPFECDEYEKASTSGNPFPTTLDIKYEEENITIKEEPIDLDE